MRSRTRWITFFVFLMFLAVGAGVVVYLSESTGVEMGGKGNVTGQAAKNKDFHAQHGWLRNNTPWDVTVTHVTVNTVNAAKAPALYFSKNAPASETSIPAVSNPTAGGADETDGSLAKTPVTTPYPLASSDIRYLGFSLTPTPKSIGVIKSITVSYKGFLGFSFSKTYDNFQLAVASHDAPDGLLATDPADDVGSFDSYIALLRSGLGSKDLGYLALVLGNGATNDTAKAFKVSQKGYSPTSQVSVAASTDGGDTKRFQFFNHDVTKDGITPIVAHWENFRWVATLAGK